jgi:hypothetical protein
MLTESEKISLAEKSANQLLYAWRAIHLHKGHNPVTERAADDFYQQIVMLISGQDRIAFEIRQYSILFEETEVFRSDSTDGNIAYFLYCEGIREISFRKGLTYDEALGLVSIVTADPGHKIAVDNLYDRIWAQDFKHIRCIIEDPFFCELTGSKAVVKSDSPDTCNIPAELEKIYRDASGKACETSSMPEFIELNDDELLSLQTDTDNNRIGRAGKMVAVALEMYLLIEVNEYRSIEAIIEKAVEYDLARERLDVFVELLSKIKPYFADNVQNNDIRLSLQNIISYFSSARFLNQVAAMLDKGMRLDVDTYEKLSEVLSGKSVVPLIRLFDFLETISARKAIIKLLVVVGNRNMPALYDALSDEKWYVVRNIVIALRRIGNEESGDYLVKLLDHVDGRVRREAITALVEIEKSKAVSIIRPALNDPDSSVRQCAIGMLGNLNSNAAKSLLIEIINCKAFIDLDYTEKREYFSALLRHNGADVIQLLGRMLVKTYFFNRAANDESRAAIAYSAGVLRKRAFLPILRGIENTGSKILRNNVSEAIRKIGNE